jgi:polyvinyl alcohol dehydrogenase (cytochrome)
MLGPSGAPVWGSPTPDPKRKLIYFGSGENYSTPADGNSDALFAVDAMTGERRWVLQLTAHDAWNGACMVKNGPSCPIENGPDYDLAASPILADIGRGRQAVIAGQKSGDVYAVDPANGKVIWKQQVGRGGMQGGIRFGMALNGYRLFVGVNDMRQRGDNSESPDYGYPGMHALDVRTGKLLWRHVVENKCADRKACYPGISAAVSVIPGAVFAGQLDGMFRAYDEQTGRTLWEFDTTIPQQAVNGPMAQGGSMSGPGPTIADGYVVTNSGYGFSGSMPGNALLVFSVDGHDMASKRPALTRETKRR